MPSLPPPRDTGLKATSKGDNCLAQLQARLEAGLYLPKDELERWKARDPLVVLRARLERAGIGEPEIAAIDERVEAVIDEAVEFADASPSPSVEEFLEEVAAL